MEYKYIEIVQVLVAITFNIQTAPRTIMIFNFEIPKYDLMELIRKNVCCGLFGANKLPLRYWTGET